MESSAAIEPSTVPTTTTSTVQRGIAVASSTSTALPQPFDTLASDFTSPGCPRFFANFLSSPKFQACHPFSLLLQTSHGFFVTSKNFNSTTATLQAGCKADYQSCNNLIQELAVQLKKAENCKEDLEGDNQIVRQAWEGMVSYPVLYQAACLKDSRGDFCFANAVTRRQNASLADAYVYYLPLGTAMPVGTRPSCNQCLKDTMGAFHSFAGNDTLPVSDTYVAAAQQVNIACGPEWISDVVNSKSGAASMPRHSSLLLSGLAMLVGVMLSA